MYCAYVLHNSPEIIFCTCGTEKCVHVLECGLQKCADKLESCLVINWASGFGFWRKRFLQK